jgi:phage-related protein
VATVAELDVKIDAKDDATATILALDALIKSLDGNDIDIPVDIDAGGSIAKLEAELAALATEDIEIKAKIDTSGIRRGAIDMEKLNNAALQASRQVNLVAAAVITLGSALIPLGAVAVGGIMSLASAFTVAGTGAALFGLVAISAFKPVSAALKKMHTLQDQYNQAVTDDQKDVALGKMKALMDSLTPSQRAMVGAVEDFRTAWGKLVAEFEPRVFQIATEGLRDVADILPSLKPIISGTADAFLTLERTASKALKGDFWQSFLSMIGSQATPIITGLGRSIGNLIEGFAALIMAFMPMTADFTGGLEGMTKSFADWAKNVSKTQGFQDFVAYIYENVPLVLGLIASLTGALVAMGKAMAPVGEALVVGAKYLADWIRQLQQAHPQAFTTAIALLALSTGLVKLLGPVITVGRFLSLLVSGLISVFGAVGPLAAVLGIGTGALLGIVAAVALVVGGLIYAYTHFETFRTVVDTVAKALWDFAQTVGTAVMTGLQSMIDWLTTTFGPAVQAVMDFAVEQFNKIMTWVSDNSATFSAAWDTIRIILQGVWTAIVAEITGAMSQISAIWNFFWPSLSAIVQGIWTAIQGIVSGTLNIIMGIILVFAGLLAGNWGAMWKGIQQIASGALTILVGIVRGGWQIILTVFQGIQAIIWAGLSAFFGLIVGGLRNAFNTMLGIARSVGSAIAGAFSAFQRTVQSGVNGFCNAVVAAFRGLGTMIIGGLTNAFNTAKSIVSGACNAIIGIVSGLGGRMYSAGVSMLSNLAQGIRRGIGDAVGAMKEAVSRLTALLPGSPAEVGPLSGQGYSLIRGQHLTEDLAAGIASRKGLLQNAMSGLATTMAIDASAGVQTGSGGNSNVNVAPGAIVLQIGDGVNPNEARVAFDGAGDALAGQLLTILRRQ